MGHPVLSFRSVRRREIVVVPRPMSRHKDYACHPLRCERVSLRSHASVQKHKTRHRPIPGESDIARFCADRARRGDANPQQRLYVAAGRAHRHRPGIAERDRGSASRALSAEASLTAPTRTFVRQLRGRHPSARSTARAQKRDRWAFPHSDGHPGEPSEPDAELGARMPRKGGLPSDYGRVVRRVESGLLRIGLNGPRWRDRMSAQARWETLGRLSRKVTRKPGEKLR